MDERAEERAELEADDRAYLEEQRMDVFVASLTPVSEYRLPMADYER